MTEAERAVLQSIIADSERVAARARALLTQQGAAPVHDLVPLAEACRRWNISKDAGLKRAKRGAGTKLLGRWFVRREAFGP